MKFNDTNTKSSGGYVALITVLIVGAVVTTVSVGLLLYGLDFTRASQTVNDSFTAGSAANSCAESALQQIRNNTAYSGTGTMTVGPNSCTYSVTVGTGENRTITSSSTVSGSSSKITASISQINPNITITSWQNTN